MLVQNLVAVREVLESEKTRSVSVKSGCRRKGTGVGEDEVATGDLQNKSHPEPRVVALGRPSDCQVSFLGQQKWSAQSRKLQRFWEGEESLEKTYLDGPFYRWSL